MEDAPGIADALCRLGADPSPDNWRRVVENAWPLVAGSCYMIADRRGDDAVQEALLHVRAGARRFHPRGGNADDEARRWLRRVACTSALAVLRRDRRIRLRSARAAAPAPLPAPDHAAGLADDLAVLRAELAELREPDRTAVALHHLQGQDIDSVGRTLGCTPEAARKRIARALEALRKRLAGRGVVLGLAAVATALREAPAVEIPAEPSAGALHLITSPLAPTTSITLASGVALMATTAGCASAVLATILAWNYAAGTDQAPTPSSPPAKPPVVAPVDPAAVHWLDRPLPPGDTTLGQLPGQIATFTGHPVVFAVNWAGVVRGQGEPFSLAGQTARTALDHLASRIGAAWLLIEEQIVVDSVRQIAAYQTPINPPTNSRGFLDTLTYLQLASQLNLVADHSLTAPDQQAALKDFTWTAPLPLVQVMGLLARGNGLTWTWQHEAFLVEHASPVPRLLSDAKVQPLVIRGRPWTPDLQSPLLRCQVTFQAEGWSGPKLAEELTRQSGVAIAWAAGDSTIALSVKQMRLGDALEWIAKIANARLTEPELGKRLAFVPATP